LRLTFDDDHPRLALRVVGDDPARG
jgi:hypothetical protein